MFGEMALIDRRNRSANALAKTSGELFVLERSATERMQAERPALYIKLMTNIARELSGRLRSTTEQLRALEAE
jgi:CRP-like cAMP-binding protein